MAKFVLIDEDRFRKSSARAERMPAPEAVSVRFDRRTRRIVIRLNNGMDLAFNPRQAHGLESVSESDLSGLRVEGAGGTLHIPKLDADFSIARLVEGFLEPMDWARREARAEASRMNGKLGGRPRKRASQAA